MPGVGTPLSPSFPSKLNLTVNRGLAPFYYDTDDTDDTDDTYDTILTLNDAIQDQCWVFGHLRRLASSTPLSSIHPTRERVQVESDRERGHAASPET